MKRRSFPSRHAEPRMSLDNDAEAVVAGPPATTVRSARAATPNQVLAIVCVATCLANLDLFVVNVGLPNIARDFRGASLEDLSWILNGYAIAYAALLVFFGRLAERHRRDLSFSPAWCFSLERPRHAPWRATSRRWLYFA